MVNKKYMLALVSFIALVLVLFWGTQTKTSEKILEKNLTKNHSIKQINQTSKTPPKITLNTKPSPWIDNMYVMAVGEESTIEMKINCPDELNLKTHLILSTGLTKTRGSLDNEFSCFGQHNKSVMVMASGVGLQQVNLTVEGGYGLTKDKLEVCVGKTRDTALDGCKKDI